MQAPHTGLADEQILATQATVSLGELSDQSANQNRGKKGVEEYVNDSSSNDSSDEQGREIILLLSCIVLYGCSLYSLNSLVGDFRRLMT